MVNKKKEKKENDNGTQFFSPFRCNHTRSLSVVPDFCICNNMLIVSVSHLHSYPSTTTNTTNPPRVSHQGSRHENEISSPTTTISSTLSPFHHLQEESTESGQDSQWATSGESSTTSVSNWGVSSTVLWRTWDETASWHVTSWGSGRLSDDAATWAGHGKGSSRSDDVGRCAVHEGGWLWAVGCDGRDRGGAVHWDIDVDRGGSRGAGVHTWALVDEVVAAVVCLAGLAIRVAVCWVARVASIRSSRSCSRA